MPAHECPACQREIRYRDEHAGRAVKCPECGETVRLPFIATPPPIASSPPPAADPLRSLRRQVLGLWCALAGVTLLSSSALIVAARSPAAIELPAVGEREIVVVKDAASPPVPVPRVSVGAVERVDRLVAKQIHVVDEAGQPRIGMAVVDGTAGISIYGADGRGCAVLMSKEDGGALSLLRGDGERGVGITIEAGSNGSYVRAHADPTGKEETARVVIAVAPIEGRRTEAAGIVLLDENGQIIRSIE